MTERVSLPRTACLRQTGVAILVSAIAWLSSACVIEHHLCANGRIDTGEECDDSNLEDGDGCDSNCQFEPFTVCGNGIVEGLEQCDDANAVEKDGCDTNCKWSCEANFECNDGDACNGTEVCDLSEHRCILGDAPLGDGVWCDAGKVCLDEVCRPICFDETDCADLGFCAGAASCTGGACVHEPPPDGTTCVYDEVTLSEGICVAGACLEPTCGDGVCTEPENADDCYMDCGECGDGVCTAAGDESVLTCEVDCPDECGDGLCTHDEDADLCYDDCGECGNTLCEGPENHETCSADCEPPPRYCIATYSIDPTFHVEMTPQGDYDEILVLPGGSMTLRYQADELNAPKEAGTIEVLHLWVRQEYVTGILGSSFFPEITTTVNLYTPRCSGLAGTEEWNPPPVTCEDDLNELPMALGTYSTGSVQWSSCDVHSDWESTSQWDYTPDDASSGTGCLGSLRSRGVASCIPATFVGCDTFDLETGDNLISDVWNQPLHPLTLDASGESLSFAKTNLPNRWHARYYLEFGGTIVDRACDLP